MQDKIKINHKYISIIKPNINANYNSKTILTYSTWEYVELWLKRQQGQEAKNALFFWRQAKHFSNASNALPLNSKPLTAYYCCLNATKALLTINGYKVNQINHGISKSKSSNKIADLDKEIVIFQGSGVLNCLSNYLKENDQKCEYTIKNLLYNIPCVHRTFTVTYPLYKELFIPIYDVNFVKDNQQSKAWIEFRIDEKYLNKRTLDSIPKIYERTYHGDKKDYYRRKKKFEWDIHNTTINKRVKNLKIYHAKVRKDLFYISGNSKLWYVKKDIKSNENIIKRSSLTLIFAVMHWMSELVRYNPKLFNKYLNSKDNWLLHEFINISLNQFIDEISCEITGEEIMSPGYRNR